MNLLIIDDVAEVRELLKLRFDAIEGVDVIGEAADARTAYEMILRYRPAAVSLDIKLQKRSGMELIDFIRQELPGCVIMLLSNYSSKHVRKAGLNAGADYYFDKLLELEDAALTMAREAERMGTYAQ